MTAPIRKSLPGLPLALLIALSLVGTALLIAFGGKAALVSLMAATLSNKTLFVAGFAAWALAANCLVLPAGSLSLMAGGAVLGALLPAALWFTAQLVTAPIVYRAAATRKAWAEAMVHRYLGAAKSRFLEQAAEAGVATTIVLRLTPVLPSAPAALAASWAGIGIRDFLTGSVLAGWVRPLYFASIGATAGSLTQLADLSEALSLSSVLPLGLVFACAALALYLRLRLSRPAAVTEPSRAPPG